MKAGLIRGVVVGISASFFFIVENILKADPHRLSVYPDLLTFLVFAAGLWWTLPFARGEMQSGTNLRRAYLQRGIVLVVSSSLIYAGIATVYAVIEHFGLVGTLALSAFIASLILGFVAMGTVWLSNSTKYT